ncbi:MAG: helix-turn-helix domain-containing protein [Acidimicrobiia bacterium]|nr:helix-turn-helix domain-containing protein [Acidimicrobiia bacterium]
MLINGSALAALRERSGLSQSALSKLTGMSQGRISEIEAAGHVKVRPATATKLAEALAVPVVVLVAVQPEGQAS